MVLALLDEQCVINANEQFWQQMLSMNLVRLPFPEEFCLGPGHLVASVDLEGAWRGRIEARLAERLAYEATATMMMQPAETVTIEDVLDATKEIANMIAGGIKPSLPRPSTMTVPESERAGKHFCSRTRTADALVVVFRHTSGDLLVRVWER